MDSESDDEYTPTDDEVETHFHEYAAHLEATEPGTYPFRTWEEALRGYRRWIAAHDAEVRQAVLEEVIKKLAFEWLMFLPEEDTAFAQGARLAIERIQEAFDETDI